MTGVSIVNQYYAENLLKYAAIAGAWIKIATLSDDYMSVEENECRRQPGQQVIASLVERGKQRQQASSEA